MKLLLGLAVLSSTVACHGPRLFDAAPLRDDGKPCRTYAEGVEYCGARQGGMPSGQGTMTLANGWKLAGRFEGPVVHDGELTISEQRIIYGEFNGPSPDGLPSMRGSFQVYNPSNSETTQVLVEGESRREVVFSASGAPRRIAEWQGESDTKQVMALEPDGSQTFYREQGGQPTGDVLRIDDKGGVTHSIYDKGADVTQHAMHDRILSDAQAMALADGTAAAEKAASDAAAAKAALSAALSDASDAEAAAAEKRADDSVKGPCKCIAEKRQAGKDVRECNQIPRYSPPRESDCYCTFSPCITLRNHDDVCDEECERAIKERNERTKQVCYAEADVYYAAQRQKFQRRTEICSKFGSDPAAIDREWDRLAAEHNAEVERELSGARERTRQAVQSAQKAVEAAAERDRAARERIKAAQEARESALKRETEIARQRIEAEARRQAEENKKKHREHCAAHPNHCGCYPIEKYRPKPGSGGACPA